MSQNKPPSGAAKRRKVKAEKLLQSASDSKQRKLDFFSPPTSPSVASASPSPVLSQCGASSSSRPDEVTSPPSERKDKDILDLSLDENARVSLSDADASTEVDMPRTSSARSRRSLSPPASPFSVCSVELGDIGKQSLDEDENILSPQAQESSPFAGFGKSSALTECEKEVLITLHPVQPETKVGCPVKLPFDKERVYYQEAGGEKRLWLSYCMIRRLLYCWICHGFGERKGPFATSGWGSEAQWKVGHCYAAIDAHENSVSHVLAVNAFLAFSQQRSIKNQLTSVNLSLRARQVAQRRDVVLRIINIVLFLAKQSIAFRGDKSEAAYTLHSSCNHGNFLEEVKSRAVFDPVLRAHLDTVIEKSQDRHAAHPSSRGRGSLITFLSKSTFLKILEITADMILERIRQEIEMFGGKFSITMDGCQDISVKEQMATVVRYTNDHGPVERLVDVTALVSTASEALLDHALKVISVVALLVNLVGYSFDGAGNMAGIKTGLQARLKELVPNSLFQHCYSHMLNLVLEKACNSVPEAVAFFDLMRETANSIAESYKRMEIWSSACSTINSKILSLVKQNKTRWWSKAKGLKRIFSDDEALLPVIITTLEIISKDPEIPARPRAKYAGELKKWCNFETLATGMLFHQIFTVSQPVSDYLQCPQLDHVQAARLSMNLVPEVSSISLDQVLSNAKLLADTCNGELTQLNEDSTFVEKFGEVKSRVETQCSRKRVSVVPRRHGERAADEKRQLASESGSPNYLLKVHALQPMLERCISELRDRFNEDSLAAFKACSFLNPERFDEVVKDGIPRGALDNISSLAGVEATTVCQELLAFAKSYATLKLSLQDDFEASEDITLDVDFEDDPDTPDADNDDAVASSVGKPSSTASTTAPLKSCKGCLRCPYRLLRMHSLYTSAFKNLTKVYQVALALPCTQVTCERCFSRMKIIKNRLRNRMEEYLLRHCMIISVEREIASKLDLVDILNKLAMSSTEMTRLLSLT